MNFVTELKIIKIFLFLKFVAEKYEMQMMKSHQYEKLVN